MPHTPKPNLAKPNPARSQTQHVRRDPPPPLPNDGVRTVLVGTVIWAVALVVSLPFAGRLRDDGHLWWIATCAVGVGLGLLGLVYCKRRADKLRRSGVNPGTSD